MNNKKTAPIAFVSIFVLGIVIGMIIDSYAPEASFGLVADKRILLERSYGYMIAIDDQRRRRFLESIGDFVDADSADRAMMKKLSKGLDCSDWDPLLLFPDNLPDTIYVGSLYDYASMQAVIDSSRRTGSVIMLRSGAQWVLDGETVSQ